MAAAPFPLSRFLPSTFHLSPAWPLFTLIIAQVRVCLPVFQTAACLLAIKLELENF